MHWMRTWGSGVACAIALVVSTVAWAEQIDADGFRFDVPEGFEPTDPEMTENFMAEALTRAARGGTLSEDDIESWMYVREEQEGEPEQLIVMRLETESRPGVSSAYFRDFTTLMNLAAQIHGGKSRKTEVAKLANGVEYLQGTLQGSSIDPSTRLRIMMLPGKGYFLYVAFGARSDEAIRDAWPGVLAGLEVETPPPVEGAGWEGYIVLGLMVLAIVLGVWVMRSIWRSRYAV